MEIKGLFASLYEAKINELIQNKNETEIDQIKDKVAFDFLKYLISHEMIISDEQFKTMMHKIKIVALANDHQHVTQGDLFALPFMLDKTIANFDAQFYQALRQTMFKETLLYLKMNSEFKDSITEDFEKKTLAIEHKNHAAELMTWSLDKAQFLIDSEANVLQGPQLTNLIFQQEIEYFYHQKVTEIIAILKWQAFCFKMIKECQRVL